MPNGLSSLGARVHDLYILRFFSTQFNAFYSGSISFFFSTVTILHVEDLEFLGQDGLCSLYERDFWSWTGVVNPLYCLVYSTF